MTPLLLVSVGLFVFLGATTQRVTGMGFALVASPFIVMVLGTPLGIQVVLVLGLITNLVMLIQVRADVEVRKALLLLAPAAVGVIPGSLLSHHLAPPALSILVGTMVAVAILAVVASERARVFRGTPGLMSAGFLSGFMNVTAGVGGPAVALYSLSTGWRHKNFVATTQLYGAGLNIVSIAGQGLPSWEPDLWLVVLPTLAVGLVLGTQLAKHVNQQSARVLVVAVSLTGALAAIIKGLATLA